MLLCALVLHIVSLVGESAKKVKKALKNATKLELRHSQQKLME